MEYPEDKASVQMTKKMTTFMLLALELKGEWSNHGKLLSFYIGSKFNNGAQGTSDVRADS